MKTKNNLDAYEVISALQKDIRRGNEESAMHWALELCPRYEYWMWQRLIVIAHEDIGIANPEVLGLIPAMRESYMEFRRRGRGAVRLVLANAILLLARSPKSRLADHFQCAVNQDMLHGTHFPIPDYALDIHTRRGKAKGRGMTHFLTEGTELKPESKIVDFYKRRAAKWWVSKDLIQNNWKKLKGKKSKNEPENENDDPEQLPML